MFIKSAKIAVTDVAFAEKYRPHRLAVGAAVLLGGGLFPELRGLSVIAAGVIGVTELMPQTSEEMEQKFRHAMYTKDKPEAIKAFDTISHFSSRAAISALTKALETSRLDMLTGPQRFEFAIDMFQTVLKPSKQADVLWKSQSGMVGGRSSRILEALITQPHLEVFKDLLASDVIDQRQLQQLLDKDAYRRPGASSRFCPEAKKAAESILNYYAPELNDAAREELKSDPDLRALLDREILSPQSRLKAAVSEAEYSNIAAANTTSKSKAR